MNSISSYFPASRRKEIRRAGCNRACHCSTNGIAQAKLLLGTSMFSGLEAILEHCLHGLSKGTLPFHCLCIASLMQTFY